MKKIHNPFPPDKNPCFGCSKENKHGLHLDFHEDGDELVSIWDPQPEYQGFHNILHGGIQATIMDEIASWTIFVKEKTAGVTSSMNVKFNKPLFMDIGQVTVRCKILERQKRIILLEAKMIDANGEVCSEAEINYFTYPLELAKKKFLYPGAEEFLDLS
ncbi:MAG: PaaI family thioesterase [Bacteroidales bacterium]|nr:PaaI family thioesterase [Bacteroidales bacterium]